MQNYESSAKNILILVEFARAMEKELGEISQDAFVEYSLRVGEYTSKQIIYLTYYFFKKKALILYNAHIRKQHYTNNLQALMPAI